MDGVTDPATQVVTWVPHVYKVSGHVPKSLVDGGDPQATRHPKAKPSGASYWTDEQWYRYKLLDSEGNGMPGVWVQERFTDGDHLQLTVNGSGSYWTATLFATVDSGTVNVKDGLWTGPSGQNFDVLWYSGWPANDNSDATITHSYYAGTSDATATSTSGVFLGEYLITLSLAHQQRPGLQASPPLLQDHENIFRSLPRHHRRNVRLGSNLVARSGQPTWGPP